MPVRATSCKSDDFPHISILFHRRSISSLEIGFGFFCGKKTASDAAPASSPKVSDICQVTGFGGLSFFSPKSMEHSIFPLDRDWGRHGCKDSSPKEIGPS
jgi:hypothetical protein